MLEIGPNLGVGWFLPPKKVKRSPWEMGTFCSGIGLDSMEPLFWEPD